MSTGALVDRDDQPRSPFAEARRAVRQLELSREHAERRFQAAFDRAGVAMAIIALEGAEAGRIAAVNDAYGSMLGRRSEELVAHEPDLWTLPGALSMEIDEQLAPLVAGAAEQTVFEARLLHRDQHVVWVSVSAASFRDEYGAQVAILHLVDISERRRCEASLQHTVDHDPLTGLFNRRRFDEELQRELTRVQRFHGQAALIMLDLDGLTSVNESLGHAMGDELMARIAETIVDLLRESDVVARVGGDEFAVLLPQSDEYRAASVAKRLLGEIRARGMVLAERSCTPLTSSIGITSFTGLDETSADDLLIEADIAVSEAKAAGKDRVRVYSREHDHRDEIATRQGWLNRLRDAIANEQLVLFAQPLTAVRGSGTPWFELLLRLPDEDGALILPGTFLHDAERFGLMLEIDRWVLTQAVRMLAGFRRDGVEVRFSVNVSAAAINEGRLEQHLSELLSANEIADGSLVIEIAETAAIANIERIRELSRALRSLGCRLAIDDFGAGFATLYYLKHMAFDYIKIDGEFISSLPSTPIDQLVVQAVVDIAHGVGAETVAEFVGDEETVKMLDRFGIGYAQGYHTGRPAPLEMLLPTRAG